MINHGDFETRKLGGGTKTWREAGCPVTAGAGQ